MNKKIKMALYIILALIIFMACLSVWYVNDYSHADASVNAYLNGTENVSVEKVENGLFLDGPGNDSALIFYPGAKIEYVSYLPLFMDLSNDGVDCFLVEMPGKIVGTQKGETSNSVMHMAMHLAKSNVFTAF